MCACIHVYTYVYVYFCFCFVHTHIISRSCSGNVVDAEELAVEAWWKITIQKIEMLKLTGGRRGEKGGGPGGECEGGFFCDERSAISRGCYGGVGGRVCVGAHAVWRRDFCL